MKREHGKKRRRKIKSESEEWDRTRGEGECIDSVLPGEPEEAVDAVTGADCLGTISEDLVYASWFSFYLVCVFSS